MSYEKDRGGLPLPHRDSVEFSAALLIGAAAGVFAALALRPERSRRDRIRRKVRGPIRRVRKQREATTSAAGAAVDESTRLGRDLGELGREFVDAAGAELKRALSEGRGRKAGGVQGALEGLRRLRDRL